MITIREVDIENDYVMFCGWWAAHKWPSVIREVLPKLGVVALADEVPTAAAWLYMDNSVGVCQMEYLVTNPKASPFDSIRCTSHIITFLSQRAVEMDYGLMLTACRQPSLVKLYERNGFIKTDEGVTHLLMPLRLKGDPK
jgi:hypothetical protein